jgi:acyl-CoA synthetase (AMP-forming)/AMP-acid ligase II
VAKSGVREIIVFAEAEGAAPFDSLLTGGESPETHVDPTEDLVALPYSSGTTGISKGAMLTHATSSGSRSDRLGYPHRRGREIIVVLPFFHIYGMTVIMNGSLYKGATMITMPRFELEPFLKAIQDFRITRQFLAPFWPRTPGAPGFGGGWLSLHGNALSTEIVSCR